MAAPGRRASFTPFTAFRPVADEKCDRDSAFADDYLVEFCKAKLVTETSPKQPLIDSQITSPEPKAQSAAKFPVAE